MMTVSLSIPPPICALSACSAVLTLPRPSSGSSSSASASVSSSNPPSSSCSDIALSAGTCPPNELLLNEMARSVG